jgi:pSer/pThr/pTyr-binding forkhead associated (FHA) protein
MATITVRVLEGLERGRVYLDLPTPVSIGREEDNDIQLNDDRISRFHAKLQDDQGNVILTDLDSTNGTRVNGHPVQMHVLRTGDVLSLGRCLLLYEEVSCSGNEGGGKLTEDTAFRTRDELEAVGNDSDDLGLFDPPTPGGEERSLLFNGSRPELPERLSALQRARLTDLLAYVHERMGDVLLESTVHPGDGENVGYTQIVCPGETWSRLAQLTAELAECLRELGDPDA